MYRCDNGIELTIGSYIFKNVANVVIDSGRKTLSDTAVITLPRKYNIGNDINETVKLSEKINIGDAVEIKIGYNAQYTDYFYGYVKQVNPQIPFIVECEDEMWQLKREPATAVTWETITLDDLVKWLVPGATVNVPEINLTNFVVAGKNNNKANVLEHLKEAYGLDAYYRNKTLFVGIPYTDTATVNQLAIYDFNYNVIKDTNNLKFISEDSINYRIKMVSYNPDNTTVTYYTGDTGGQLRTFHEYNKTSDELKAIGDEKLKLLKYEGYTGSFRAFGLPACEHGWAVELRNEERPGTNRYFIDRVIKTFGRNGFKKQIFLGRKAS